MSRKRNPRKDRARIDQQTDKDCLRCCVAMVLCIEYEDVPDFVAEHGYDWAAALANWALGRGCHTLSVSGHSVLGPSHTRRKAPARPGSPVGPVAV